MRVKLAPSILSADFARLADAIAEAEAGGADWIHVDVMDGHFVPNLTIGPPVVRSLRKVTKLPLDVHLMIENPDALIGDFAEAGADIITVHQEACTHLHRTVQHIHASGARAGVAINPATPTCFLDDILSFVDLVLVMSVNPGFGGQKFIETSPARIERVRAALAAAGRGEVEIEVDGGIDEATVSSAADAGATVMVAGAAVFNDRASVAENIARLRRKLDHTHQP
jgi:ribulose-phosphate 3-epimerase